MTTYPWFETSTFFDGSLLVFEQRTTNTMQTYLLVKKNTFRAGLAGTE